MSGWQLPSHMLEDKPSHWLRTIDTKFVEATSRHRAVVEGSGDLTAAKLTEISMGFPPGAIIDEVKLHLEHGTWAVVAIWEYGYAPKNAEEPYPEV